ncbi:hypothetical protein ACFE04_016723 [Oxalis oulophora]
MSDHLPLPEDSPPPIDGPADDDDLLFCRFCYGTHATEDLIAPCNCKGTSKYVHRKCLDHWRNLQRGFAFSHCTTCKARYTRDLVGVAAYWKSYLLGFLLPVFTTFPLLTFRTLLEIYKESGFRHAYASDNSSAYDLTTNNRVITVNNIWVATIYCHELLRASHCGKKNSKLMMIDEEQFTGCLFQAGQLKWTSLSLLGVFFD